jgi:hypothetical protein
MSTLVPASARGPLESTAEPPAVSGSYIIVIL